MTANNSPEKNATKTAGAIRSKLLEPLWEQLKRFWLTLVLFLIVIFFIIAWVSLNTFDSVKNNLRSVSSNNIGAGQQLIIDYPVRLLYDDPPRKVRITRKSTSPLTNPLTITVLHENGLIFSDTVYANGDVTLIFSSTELFDAHSLYVANARTVTGTWRPLSKSIIVTGSAFISPLKLPVEVEGAHKAIWRIFLNKTVNEKTPLAILILALVSIIIFFWQKHYEQKERERNEQERKRNEQKNRKNAAENSFNEIKKALREANTAKARAELLKSQKNLQNYINSADIQYAEKLLNIANEKKLLEFVKSTHWRAETAGALIAQWDNQKADDPITFIEAIKFIQDKWRTLDSAQKKRLNEISEQWAQTMLTGEKRKELDKSWERRQKGDSGSVPWRPVRNKPSLLLDVESGIRNQVQYPLFGHKKTEDDVDFLFGESGGFWSKHPVYNHITRSMRPQVIIGKSGSGKTAFARALMEIGTPEGLSLDVFPVYIRRLTGLESIRQKFTEQILQFICVLPSMLMYFGVEGQELLAKLLCSSLNCDTVLAEISGAKQKFAAAYASDKKKEGKSAKEDVQPTQTLDILFLDSFYHTLKRQRKNAEQFDTVHDWRRIARLFITSLGFASAWIILDLDAVDKHILSSLYQWADYKLIIKLFLPQLDSHWFGQLDVIKLTWNDSQLQQMAEWRLGCLKRLTNNRLTLPMLFENETLYARFFDAANGSPRRLARVWQALFEAHLQHSPDKLTFSEENFERALESLQQ